MKHGMPYSQPAALNLVTPIERIQHSKLMALQTHAPAGLAGQSINGSQRGAAHSNALAQRI